MDKKIEKASERWIKEGKAYKTAVNDWIDTIYIKGVQPKTNCPEETRRDMADYVIEQLIEFNKEGKHEQFRQLFPPDNDPLTKTFDNSSLWSQVRKVAILNDNRIIVKIGDYYQSQEVYEIINDKISLIEDVIGFGFSDDKKYFARVYRDKISINEGWDGPLVCTLSLPDGMDIFELQFDSIEVFSTGNQVVLVTHQGIFLINENTSELIHGGAEEENEEDEDNDEIEEDDEEDEDSPARPESVPAEAHWNSSEGEWETGKRNASGNPVGEWKWWLAPKGYLCCHTFYEGEEGNIFSFTRFHEDGTPSRVGKYVDGQPFGEITWFRSENPTIEHYPPNAGPDVWKSVSIVKNGYTVEEHYYDKKGNEIQEAYISNTELSDLLKKMGVANRFYLEKNWKWLLDSANDIIDSEVADDDDEEQMKAVFYKAYATYELNNKQINGDLIDLAEAITDLDTFSIWPYLKEFNIIRTALRFAHYIKAQSAIDEEDYEDAWDELKEALEITSPIDDEDMSPYHTMKKLLASKIDLDESETNESEAEESKYRFLHYPHAAVSPDDKYIVVGSQSSDHIVLVNENGNWTETSNIVPRSSYPNIARFNYRLSEPVLALGSCHFSESGTLGVLVSNLEDLQASGWDMDSEALFVIDDKKWVFSMLDSGKGFFLGCNDGYIWLKLNYNDPAQYIFIGGTPMSIDVSPDRKYLVVGTHSGQVLLLNWQNIEKTEGKSQRIDPYLITNLPVVDEKRYIFTMNTPPLIW